MKDGLEYYIDSKYIPDFLGGPCTVMMSLNEFVHVLFLFIFFVNCSGVREFQYSNEPVVVLSFYSLLNVSINLKETCNYS